MKHFRLLLTAVAVTTAIPVTSFAQGPGWLEDRSRAQGPGFRLGNFELHPGVGAEVGYDSNVFYRDAGGLRPREGSAIFRLTPHVFVSNLTGARLTEGEGRRDDSSGRMFELEAGASSEVYVFLNDNVPHNIAVDGHFDLNINPHGRFGFQIYDRLSRRVRPFTNQIDFRRMNHAQLGNIAGAKFHGRTRGGLLQASIGYAFNLQFLESADFRYANRLIHQISADTHFRFLPNTSLFWEANADYATFPNDGGPLLLANHWRLRTRVGINGAVTPKVSATLALGYTSVFVQDDRIGDFDTLTALAGLKVRLTPTVSFGFGYERDSQDSVVGLFRIQDRGYLDLQWLLGRSFLLAMNLWVGQLRFGDILDGTGASLGDRQDIMVSARLFGEYRFNDWLALNATVGFIGDYTDFQYVTSLGMGPLLEPAGFNKFEAWLGVRAFY